MIWNGIKCRESRTLTWREGNPEMDVDLNGQPVDNKYYVLVRVKDCPAKMNYPNRPEGIKQAFPITCESTRIAYGKPKIVKNGEGRHVMVTRDNKMCLEWLTSYVKIPYYVVLNNRVYVGAVYKEHLENEKA
jgi:hypothetical protein